MISTKNWGKPVPQHWILRPTSRSVGNPTSLTSFQPQATSNVKDYIYSTQHLCSIISFLIFWFINQVGKCCHRIFALLVPLARGFFYIVHNLHNHRGDTNVDGCCTLLTYFLRENLIVPPLMQNYSFRDIGIQLSFETSMDYRHSRHRALRHSRLGCRSVD